MPSDIVIDLLYVAGFVLASVGSLKVYASMELKKAEIDADAKRDKTRMYVDRDNMQARLEYQAELSGFDEPQDSGDFDFMSILNNPQVMQLIQNNPKLKDAVGSLTTNNSQTMKGDKK